MAVAAAAAAAADSSTDATQWFGGAESDSALARQCVTCLRHCTEWLKRHYDTLVSPAAVPLPKRIKGLKAALRIVRASWSKGYTTKQHINLDNNKEYSLADFITVCWCYLSVCQNPGWVREYACANVRETQKLQEDMRRCQLQWHFSGAAKTQELMETIPQLKRRFMVAVVVHLSDWPVNEDWYSAPAQYSGPGESGVSQYQDIDINATFENRTRELDTKTREEDQDVPLHVDDPRLKKAKATVNAPRLLHIGTRLLFAVEAHMDVLNMHDHLLDEWPESRMMDSSFHTHVADVVTYIITPQTQKNVTDMYLLRNLPSGARECLLRHSSGLWKGVELRSVCVSELGDKQTSKLMEVSQQFCQDVFQVRNVLNVHDRVSKLKQMKWTMLHDTWLVALWDRLVRTLVLSPMLNEILLLEPELTRLKHTYNTRDQVIQGFQARIPRIIEACGRWFVSVIHYEVTEQHFRSYLVPCANLRVALHCWAAFTMIVSHGQTEDGRELHTLLQQVVDVEQCKREKWCVFPSEENA